jgi:steroid delta-isomerase-like uncharacterized protein
VDDLDRRSRSRLHIVREHIRLENAHDLAGVMDTFGPVARYDDEPWKEHYRGRDAVRAFYVQLFEAIPDLRIEVQAEHVTSASVVVECLIRGSQEGAWRGLPPTGRGLDLPLCGVYTFDASNRLTGERIYYDRATVLGQLGVFREPSSPIGRLCLLLNHPLALARAWLRGRRAPRHAGP